MFSSQRKATKSTKTTKASKKKSAPPLISIPPTDCYVPQPVDTSMASCYSPTWGVNNWLSQFTSFSPQPSPPLESLSQFTPESQFLINTPRRLEQENSDDDEEETEEEEEEAPTDKGKAPRLAWQDDEVRALGEAWVDCSQQAGTGTNQTTNVYKVKVWQSWCRRMSSTYRNPNLLYSKWRTCNKGAMEFQECHGEVERQRQSGPNGDDVMAKARLLYQAQYGSQFNQEVFWRAVKDYEKWRELESFDQLVIHLAKKHKVSESTQSPSSETNVGFNLNYDPPQPMGRDEAKRKKRGKGQTTSTNSSVHEDLLALSGNVDTYKEAQQIKESNLKIKEKMQLRKIIQQDISNKTGFEYELTMEMKRDAARQLGYRIKSSL